jgi:hypothetical protein
MHVESTIELVAGMRAAQRRSRLRYAGPLLGVVAGMAVIGALESRRGSVQEVGTAITPPAGVDIVSYPLPEACSLADLSARLWQGEVSATEILHYNPAIQDTTARLDAGTVVDVPNYRDFPVEELAVPPAFRRQR